METQGQQSKEEILADARDVGFQRGYTKFEITTANSDNDLHKEAEKIATIMAALHGHDGKGNAQFITKTLNNVLAYLHDGSPQNEELSERTSFIVYATKTGQRLGALLSPTKSMREGKTISPGKVVGGLIGRSLGTGFVVAAIAAMAVYRDTERGVGKLAFIANMVRLGLQKVQDACVVAATMTTQAKAQEQINALSESCTVVQVQINQTLTGSELFKNAEKKKEFDDLTKRLMVATDAKSIKSIAGQCKSFIQNNHLLFKEHQAVLGKQIETFIDNISKDATEKARYTEINNARDGRTKTRDKHEKILDNIWGFKKVKDDLAKAGAIVTDAFNYATGRGKTKKNENLRE